MNAPVLTTVEAGVARVTLNRPEKRNALDRATIAALTAQLQQCAGNAAVRVVQLTGAGKAFCAGADLTEMQAQAGASEAANLADAEQLAALLALLDTMPKPTLARVNGDGYGGALGLIAACDIVVAVEAAKFAFTEVRLGIIPAVISPFVLGKIGESAARRYFLTAETLTRGSPEGAWAGARSRGRRSARRRLHAHHRGTAAGGTGRPGPSQATDSRYGPAAARDRSAAAAGMAARLARLRVQAEAQEGFSAFFDKRKPAWRPD